MKCFSINKTNIFDFYHKIVESNLIIKEQTYPDKIRNLISEPWFIAMLVISSLITISLIFYCIWFVYKTCRKKRKFNSNNVLTVHKTDNGNRHEIFLKYYLFSNLDYNVKYIFRYKLVNDTIWMDTLHSSNHSNHECCCVPDLHHQPLQKQSSMF